MTCVPGTKSCKSCFDGYTLVAGSCLSCLDPNSVYCRPTNLNYSVLCYPKYSIGTSNTSNTTSSVRCCQPCADNCLKCDVNGPGNCDSSQCILGFVQLTGTLNCTACINSCPICNAVNPNICLDCGPSRYSDGQGSCLACSNRCKTCISAINCSICQLGYSLINATCYSNMGYPCAIMGSISQCNECFQGFILNGSTCVFDPSSNGTQTKCPYGYYLSNSSCLICSLTNCRACNSNLCTLCVKGYYLKAGVCLRCSSGCSDCSSATYCNQAADSYYLQNRLDGSNSGKVLACNSPCLTCEYHSDYCLMCINGYNISGSTCLSNSIFTIQIVLGPGSSNTKIFSNSDSNDVQLSEAIKSINRLLNSFCQILESSLTVSDSSCKNAFRLTSLAIGSILMSI